MQFSKVSDADLSNTFRARICAQRLSAVITFGESGKSCQFFDDTFSSTMYFLSERLKLL